MILLTITGTVGLEARARFQHAELPSASCRQAGKVAAFVTNDDAALS